MKSFSDDQFEFFSSKYNGTCSSTFRINIGKTVESTLISFFFLRRIIPAELLTSLGLNALLHRRPTTIIKFLIIKSIYDIIPYKNFKKMFSYSRDKIIHYHIFSKIFNFLKIKRPHNNSFSLRVWDDPTL